MAVYKRDIVDINLETGNIHRSFLKHSIGYKDQKADHFGIRTYRDGVPVDLTGVSVQGIFLPPQGDPIAITSGNIVDGNVAEVVLPQACYNYDGQFTLSIKLVDSNNSVTGTVRIVDGMVDNTHASGTVAPTSAVPTYQEILSTYDEMVAATAAANGCIAATYSSSSTYKVGDYCIHDGGLYRCTTAITTAEAWTSGHWTAAKIGPDVSDLKSAVNAIGMILSSSMYVVGGFGNTNGYEADATNKLRLNSVVTDDIKYVRTYGGFRFIIFAWQQNGTYVGRLCSGGFSKVSTDTALRFDFMDFDDFKATYSSYNFRLMFIKDDGSTVTTADCKYFAYGMKEGSENNPFQFGIYGNITSEGAVSHDMSNIRVITRNVFTVENNCIVDIICPSGLKVAIRGFTNGSISRILPAPDNNNVQFMAQSGVDYYFLVIHTDGSTKVSLSELAKIRMIISDCRENILVSGLTWESGALNEYGETPNNNDIRTANYIALSSYAGTNTKYVRIKNHCVNGVNFAVYLYIKDGDNYIYTDRMMGNAIGELIADKTLYARFVYAYNSDVSGYYGMVADLNYLTIESFEFPDFIKTKADILSLQYIADNRENEMVGEISGQSGATVTHSDNTGNTIALDTGGPAQSNWTTTTFKVQAGQVVVVEFYGKADHIEPSSSTGAGVFVEFIRANGYRQGNKYNGYILSKNRFGYHRYGFVAPQGIQTGKIHVFTRANTTCQIRDIRLTIHDAYPQRARNGILYDGHQGMIYSAPENTMPSFELSKAAGFSTCIVNVQQTSDGVLVCCHDATINRTARNADGTTIYSTVTIADKTYEELLDYDFGVAFASVYAGTKIPTFEEAARYLASAGIGIGTSMHGEQTSENIDIEKFCNVYKKYGMNGNNFVKSSNYGFLQAVYDVLGDTIEYVYVGTNVTTGMIDQAYAFPTKCTMEINSLYVTQALVDYAFSKGVPVSVYFGNDLLDVRNFINMGVTRFTVDTFSDNVFPVDDVDNEES